MYSEREADRVNRFRFGKGRQVRRLNLFGRQVWIALVLCATVVGVSREALAEDAAIVPVSLAYLRASLDTYRHIQEEGGWRAIPAGPALHIADAGPAVKRLKERLHATGDLTVPVGDDDRFDAVVAEAVKNFQERHGLDPDSVVGPKTREALNVTVDERIRQIETNIERLKSLPIAADKRTIVVNVAAFELTVYERGALTFASPVIVGRTSRKTPVFSSAITRIIVNPYWTVPRIIAVEDILPKIKQDPSYLTAQSIRVYRSSDDGHIEVPPKSVDWAALNSHNFPYRLIQDPGPANALGKVKFFVPNHFDVYLHDTPARELFRKDQRTFSSGCIRVDKALALAEYLLRRDGLGSFRAMADALERRETRQIDLKTPAPLHIVYLTAWADKHGHTHFRNDVYNLDAPVVAALQPERDTIHDVAMAHDTVPVPACAASPPPDFTRR